MSVLKLWADAEVALLKDLATRTPRVTVPAIALYFPDRTFYSIDKRVRRFRDEARRPPPTEPPSAAVLEPTSARCLTCRRMFVTTDRRRNHRCYECNRVGDSLGPNMETL